MLDLYIHGLPRSLSDETSRDYGSAKTLELIRKIAIISTR